MLWIISDIKYNTVSPFFISGEYFKVISSSSHVTGQKQYSSKDLIWTLHKQSRYDIDI